MMEMDAISFREAKPSDAAAIAAVHVASWRETYPGIVPDQLLSNLSVEGRSATWREILNDPARFEGTAVFIAVSEGEIVGFGACGEQRHQPLKAQGFDGEVAAIYVLRSHQGAGVGRSLMRLMAQELLERGRSAATLWVLRENLRARSFYERQGGTVVGEREEEHAGATLIEVAYGWTDLSWLVR